MTQQNNLRKQVKLLKALQGVSYKEIAELLEIKTNSFYAWVNAAYDLGEERENALIEIITNLKEV